MRYTIPFLALCFLLVLGVGCAATLTAPQQADVQTELQAIYFDGIANNAQAFADAQAHATALSSLLGTAPITLVAPAAGTPATPTPAVSK